MKRLMVFPLLALVSAASGLTGFAARAAEAGLPEVVQSLPADSRFVFGVDVKKLVAAPLYSKLVQKELDPLSANFQRIFNEAGFDPEFDIERISGASRAVADGRESFLMIASGSFDRAVITRMLLRSPKTLEKEHGKFRILTIPGRAETKNVELSVVFLNDREIAAGDLEAIESFLDTREKRKPGIMSDSTMSALFAGVNHEDTIWFAGNAAAAINSYPLKFIPIPEQREMDATAAAAGIVGFMSSTDALFGNGVLNAVNSITSVAGSVNLTDTLTGTVAMYAVNAATAGKLADAVALVINLARLASEGNPQTRLLLDGFSFSREAERITFKLNYTAEFFNQLEKAGVGK